MSVNNTIIAVDALGADKAPSVVLDGVTQALSLDENLEVLLVGPKDVVQPFCEGQDRCTPVVATESIAMAEAPALAVRKKKDSSIVIACKCVKEGRALGFYSGGNTGACLAAATLFIGRIKGVLRPMLTAEIPTKVDGKSVIFCDVGANADCKPQNILQFAIMASVYAKSIFKIENPKVGLLNIGEEDKKGNKFALECHDLIKSTGLETFAGNAEGRDILSGEFDAVVTDGFTGNVTLKNMEGTFSMIFSKLKKCFYSSAATKIAALILKPALKKMINEIDPESISAAFLIGVNGACCVGHGSSSAKAICNGILKTANFARSKNIEIIKAEIEKHNID